MANAVTVSINNQTVTADLATIAALLNMAIGTATADAKPTGEKTKTAKTDKAEAKRKKADKRRMEHDAVLDSKRVERMVKTATDKLAQAGFECKTSKQGKWVWVYPTNGQGRTPEFKAVKLAKGWKHSPKRGAFYRDFS